MQTSGAPAATFMQIKCRERSGIWSNGDIPGCSRTGEETVARGSGVFGGNDCAKWNTTGAKDSRPRSPASGHLQHAEQMLLRGSLRFMIREEVVPRPVQFLQGSF